MILPIAEAYPKISVVMTNLNGGRTLERCILAALNQTLKPIEVVIVDAGSTDISYEIAKKYEDRGVRWIVDVGCSPSKGEFLAEQEAKSDFLAVTNPDCYAMPDWLERAYSWWCKGYDVVGGIKINTGDLISFSWTAFPDDQPWETERPELGLTSMSTFATKKLLMELPIKGLLESRDVELALMAKRRGLKLIIDPKIMTLHDDPLKSAAKSFRKSASYATRHIKILKSLGSSGVAFSFRALMSDFLLINAPKTAILYRHLLERTGVKVSLFKFIYYRGVFKLGQLFGILKGVLSK